MATEENTACVWPEEKNALDAAVERAFAEGRGTLPELQRKLAYLTQQAVPENVILQVFASIQKDTRCPWMIPDPPVKFAQSNACGELTRALAYRLSGMNLRLVGNKGCGKTRSCSPSTGSSPFHSTAYRATRSSTNSTCSAA